MKELAALAYRDTTQENREFWKNEMGNALREISATYEEKLDIMRGELETHYNMKVAVKTKTYLFCLLFLCVPACYAWCCCILFHCCFVVLLLISMVLLLRTGNERTCGSGIQRYHF